MKDRCQLYKLIEEAMVNSATGGTCPDYIFDWALVPDSRAQMDAAYPERLNEFVTQYSVETPEKATVPKRWEGAKYDCEMSDEEFYEGLPPNPYGALDYVCLAIILLGVVDALFF